MSGSSGPSKKWRVRWLATAADYRSQALAYEQVRRITGRRTRATVYHWKDGGWQLYERCEPAGELEQGFLSGQDYRFAERAAGGQQPGPQRRRVALATVACLVPGSGGLGAGFAAQNRTSCPAAVSAAAFALARVSAWCPLS